MKRIIILLFLMLTTLFVVWFPHSAQANLECITPPPGMVSWWPGDGSANDIISDNNGTLQGNVTYAPGKVGQGFNFSGAGFVHIPDDPSLDLINEITIDFWYNQANVSGFRGLLSKRYQISGDPTDPNLTANFSVNVNKDFLGLGLSYNDPTVTGGDDYIAVGSPFETSRIFPAPTTSQFHHFAGTYKQVNPAEVELKMYVDGLLVKTLVLPGNLGNTLNEAPVTIGASIDPALYPQGPEYFVGVIDEVEVYNRVLLSSEIQDIYNAGAAGKCKSNQSNQSPVANAGGEYGGEEGSAINLDGDDSFDPDEDALTYNWSVDSGLCTFSDASGATPDLTCSDNGNFSVTLTVDDGEATDSDSAVVTIANGAPTVGEISVDQALISVGSTINASASFTDPGTNDTHSASWDWGDSTTLGTVTQGAGFGSVADSHTYSAAGIYMLTLTVNDDDGGSGEAMYMFVVVYDPEGGFVTGGGWINSLADACPDYCQGAVGTASFGFVSKYKKGANVPTGNTEFQFKAGDLNFHSDSYEWLVVNQGGTNAQFKGSGTINGYLAPNGELFKFQIWAKDDAPDTFRIRIWWEELDGTEHDVYDNGFNQEIGGGNIVIHQK